MEYESIDREVQYRQACENVKKIVKIIEMIRIKYYPDFSKISEGDREKYDILNSQMERIVAENKLEILSKPLMAEISGKYNGQIPQIDEELMKNPSKRNKIFDDIKLACCGAMEAEKQAWLNWEKAKEANDEKLAETQIQIAKKCQKKVEEFIETVDEYEDGQALKEEMIKYRREKFAQLVESKEQTQHKNEHFTELFKNYYIQVEVQGIKEATEVISEAQNEISNSDKNKQNEIENSSKEEQMILE